MEDPKQETSNVGQASAAAGAAKGAEKVRSSRYEWEGRAVEKENQASGSKGSLRSFMTAWAAWWRKLLSWNFFDKDDDATPSPA
jgi:hypothetical protein